MDLAPHVYIQVLIYTYYVVVQAMLLQITKTMQLQNYYNGQTLRQTDREASCPGLMYYSDYY